MANQTIGEVLDRITRKDFGFRTFPVVDEQNHLLGLLSSSTVKERYRERSVLEAMTPRSEVYTLPVSAIKDHPIEVATSFSPSTSAFTSFSSSTSRTACAASSPSATSSASRTRPPAS